MQTRAILKEGSPIIVLKDFKLKHTDFYETKPSIKAGDIFKLQVDSDYYSDGYPLEVISSSGHNWLTLDSALPVVFCRKDANAVVATKTTPNFTAGVVYSTDSISEGLTHYVYVYDESFYVYDENLEFWIKDSNEAEEKSNTKKKVSNVVNKKYYKAIKDVELLGIKIVSAGDIVEIEQKGKDFLFVGHPLGCSGFSQNDLEVYFVEYPIQASTSTDTFTKLTVEFFDVDGSLTTTIVEGNILNISFDDVTVGTVDYETPLLYSSWHASNNTYNR